ncbi:MAG: isoprenylcysteine carboxylmethyltransferase family protein [Spirochaetes bacterium]|nr:isoprenylcysteine carboxylmethyltransferase family protein [Spirochaetota bacterium]
MIIHYTQIFLFVWIIAFWIIHILTYGKVESKYEQSIAKEYEIKPKWAPFFGIAFVLFNLNILVYFFHYPSRNWILNCQYLNHFIAYLIAVILMIIAFALYASFTLSTGTAIRKGVNSNRKPELVITGIYKYIRNPGYLTFYLASTGCLLIMPNLHTLIIVIYIFIVTYGHTIEEEQKLNKIYGKKYDEYKKNTGRFFPKLKRR